MQVFRYGCGGKALKWIDSFLQATDFELLLMEQSQVLSGVLSPFLGPMLFSLHLNDILANIDLEIKLFADDHICCPCEISFRVSFMSKPNFRGMFSKEMVYIVPVIQMQYDAVYKGRKVPCF